MVTTPEEFTSSGKMVSKSWPPKLQTVEVVVVLPVDPGVVAVPPELDALLVLVKVISIARTLRVPEPFQVKLIEFIVK
jgi:hypothetical protein